MQKTTSLLQLWHDECCNTETYFRQQHINQSSEKIRMQGSIR